MQPRTKLDAVGNDVCKVSFETVEPHMPPNNQI